MFRTATLDPASEPGRRLGTLPRGAAPPFIRIAEGAMNYPQEFPLQARARVEAERLRAARDLDRYRMQLSARPPRGYLAENHFRLFDAFDPVFPPCVLKEPARVRRPRRLLAAARQAARIPQESQYSCLPLG